MPFVRSTRLRFWPDPQPLVDRLGIAFFRQLPTEPGVYLMLDPSGIVLYVGKAKNLRHRLTSYRVANPDRMPRRTLRLLSLVHRIELRPCPTETAALACEAGLLRSLKPKFNRAGTWPGPRRYLAWRRNELRIQLKVTESPDPEWRFHGPLGTMAFDLRAALARLLWLVPVTRFANPPYLDAIPPGCNPAPNSTVVDAGRHLSTLPIGWFDGARDPIFSIHCGDLIEPISSRIEELFAGQTAVVCDWFRSVFSADLCPFDKLAVEADLEFITKTLRSNKTI
jgi:hypothetical protein